MQHLFEELSRALDVLRPQYKMPHSSDSERHGSPPFACSAYYIPRNLFLRLQADIGFLDHTRPALHLVGDERREFLRRAVIDFHRILPEMGRSPIVAWRADR